VVAPPISYKVGGKQYVTVITGSGASGGGILSTGIAKYRTDYRLPRRVLTFALGGKDKIPASVVPELKAPADPTFVSNPELEQRGAVAFGMTGCLVCHGWNAIGGGSAPDLRGSVYPTHGEAFLAAVQGGALVSAGMPAFPELAVEEIEAIRQYVRARARQLKEAESQPQAAASRKAGAAVGGETFAGDWEIVVDSPIGKQVGKGAFKVEGGKITGTQSGSQGSVDVQGKVDAGHATFSGKAYTPFPISLEFNVTLDGDTFSGTMKTPFGELPVNAKRL